MINAVQGMTNTDTETSQNPSASQLGRDDFLKIFLAQLRHQDPINPMEGTEFTAQLAQFTSLEQLFNVNQNLEALKGVQGDASRFGALSLMGKEIEASGSQISLEEGEAARGSFAISGSASCVVTIKDGTGAAIRRIRLGTLGSGQHDFTWDGRDDSGYFRAPGVYGFMVTATTETGASLKSDARITGRVTRVGLEGSEPKLYIGEIPVALSQVLDVRAGAVGAGDDG
jgi:flagellar basal-body rod modification protein FlgD